MLWPEYDSSDDSTLVLDDEIYQRSHESSEICQSNGFILEVGWVLVVKALTVFFDIQNILLIISSWHKLFTKN